uniref:Uncharacterized protein n=1 Tax=Megaselia scalaris TaxID=36166 RepID=T1GAI0_MEGSC
MANSSPLCREDFDGGPISLDLIEPHLYLDLTKEDILQSLESCTEFIADAVEKEENILVHW